MVKIRYSELPSGLHVAATADREDTVVYLQPGLTTAQRRAALIRVRSSARVGHGPTLPRRDMARAIAADRLHTTAHIGAAAARRHPVLFLPPVIAVLLSAIVFMFMSVQPVAGAGQGRIGQALPALGPNGGHTKVKTATHRQRHPRLGHRAHRAGAAGLTHLTHVALTASPSACATGAWSDRASRRTLRRHARFPVAFTGLCGRLGPLGRCAPTAATSPICRRSW